MDVEVGVTGVEFLDVICESVIKGGTNMGLGYGKYWRWLGLHNLLLFLGNFFVVFLLNDGTLDMIDSIPFTL